VVFGPVSTRVSALWVELAMLVSRR
jgi:hypothetical protein